MDSESSQGSQLSSQIQDSLIGDTLSYILSQDHTKYPVKRQDIVKSVCVTYGKNYKFIMDKVTLVLKEVFGMKLVDADPNINIKQYILVNSEECSADVSYLKWPGEVEAEQILLMLALSLIFMSDGVVNEGVMWSFLQDLGIMKADRSHEYFGDVQKLLTGEFVQQLYLECTCIPDCDTPAFEFRWGQRAEEEVSRCELLKFVSMVYRTEPGKWTTQFQRALRAEHEKIEVWR